MLHRFLGSVLGVLVFLYGLLGVGAAVFHFMRPPYNEAFGQYPLIVNLHVILGAVYLLIGAFQFSPIIRNRWINYHRWAGRFLAITALIVGSSAIFMGLIIPFSGVPEQVIMGVFGTYYIASTIVAFISVRAGRIAQHREWMIRAFAVGSAVVTMRLIFTPLLIINQVDSIEAAARYSIIAFSVAFIAHSLFAELWIRFTRAKRDEPQIASTR